MMPNLQPPACRLGPEMLGIAFLIGLLVRGLPAAEPPVAPLPPAWAQAWPVAAPLNIERVGVLDHNGMQIERLRYTGSVWKGQPQRFYALYAHPAPTTPGQKFPAIVQVHGGGQTCYPSNVAWFVQHGYACISLDWGGPRDNRPLDQVTSFSSGVSLGYLDFAPEGPPQKAIFHAVLAARRAIDVLEQFPEVDRDRIGLQGVSWGSVVAWLVGAQEPRLKAVVPVYGVGGLYRLNTPEGIALRQEQPAWVRQWTEYFDPLGYAAHQLTPVLLLSTTNDSFGRLKIAEEVLAQVPVEHRHSYGANSVHSLEPVTLHAGMAWFDHWLKQGPALPAEPRLDLQVDARHRLVARVTVPGAKPRAVRVDFARGPAEDQVKCWLSQPATRTPAGDYVAEIPLVDPSQPLDAVAQVFYPSDLMLSSPVRSLISARDLANGPSLKADNPSSLTISDWRSGPSGWYLDRSTDFPGVEQPPSELTTTTLDGRPALVLSPPAGFELMTRLPSDPARRRDHALPLEIWTHDVARLTVRLNRSLRLPGAPVHETEITPGPGWQCTRIPIAQFKRFDEVHDRMDPAGPPLANWKELYKIGLTIQPTPSGTPAIGQIAWHASQ